MINTFDLHVHTTASDGENTPTEIVRLAASTGIKTIGITDHDNIDGIEEGIEAGKEMGVRVIPGVELSTQFQDSNGIHILGYFIDHTDQTLINILDEFKAVRERRGEIIVEAINKHLGKQNLAPLSIQKLRDIAEGSVGRPHISRLLIEMGYAKNTVEAFEKFLVPFNIPKKKITPQEAIELINNAGGIAVLAHPHMWSESREEVSREDMAKGVRAIAGYGVVGLEAFYPGYTQEDADFFCSLAGELGLVVTAGTDYHSTSHPGTPLGFFTPVIPQDLVDKLRIVSGAE
jgi:predicted metal-dependent phosphoesterase TrpH